MIERHNQGVFIYRVQIRKFLKLILRGLPADSIVITHKKIQSSGNTPGILIKRISAYDAATERQLYVCRIDRSYKYMSRSKLKFKLRTDAPGRNPALV